MYIKGKSLQIIKIRGTPGRSSLTTNFNFEQAKNTNRKIRDKVQAEHSLWLCSDLLVIAPIVFVEPNINQQGEGYERLNSGMTAA